MPNLRSTTRRPLDGIGLVLSGAALSAILYGAELASQAEHSPVIGLLLVGLGAGIGGLAYWHARRQSDPLIDVTTLNIPTFAVTIFSGSLGRIGISAVPYLMPLLFQIGFGLSAFHSGLLLLASAGGNLGMKALTTTILRRYGFKRVAILNSALCGLVTIACGWLAPEMALAWVLSVAFVYGVTRSMQFSTLAMLAYADVPAAQMGAANTLWNAVTQMGMGLGIAFGALALRAAATLHGTQVGQPYTLADFRIAFLCAGVLVLISIGGYARLAQDAGHKIGGAAR